MEIYRLSHWQRFKEFCKRHKLFTAIATILSTILAILPFLLTEPEIHVADGQKSVNGDLVAPAKLEITLKYAWMKPFYTIYYTTNGTNPATSKSRQEYNDEQKVVLHAGQGGTVCAKACLFNLIWTNESISKQTVYDPSISDYYIPLKALNFHEGNRISLALDETKYLEIIPTPLNATESEFLWESDNPDIVSVRGDTKYGGITGHKQGTAKVTATSVYQSGLKVECVVTVTGNETLSETYPSHSSEAISTSKPTSSPKPVSTSRPANTPEPVRTPQPINTPKPISTTEPISTPRPVSTPEPIYTPQPTVTQIPSNTPEPSPEQNPIRIISCSYSKGYEAEIKQSSFTIDFSTNIRPEHATLTTYGQTYPVSFLSNSGGMMTFDRKYFYSSSYNFVLTVFDEYGNQDEDNLLVSLDEVTISLSDISLDLAQGDTYTIVANVTGLAGHSVQWQSSNPDVVHISKDSVLGEAYSTATITALSSGDATITAKVANRVATCSISIK